MKESADYGIIIELDRLRNAVYALMLIYGACRDNSCTTSDRFVRILDFRHFERFFRFDQSDRKTYKKAISDGVNVSVVLDCGFGNTSKEK